MACTTVTVERQGVHFITMMFLRTKVLFSGTGSTSWTYNVNKLTEQNMEEILTIVKEETGFKIRDTDEKFVRKITETFNQMLITSPGKLSSYKDFMTRLVSAE